jgi:hypothetical protein
MKKTILCSLFFGPAACVPPQSSPAPVETDPRDSGDSDSSDSHADSGDSAGSDSGDSDSGPTDTGVGSGLSGGWSIEHSEEVAGARFIHPVNTDKDGAIVAARLASALGALGTPATSDSRAATVAPTRMVDAAYRDEVADFLVDDLYGGLARVGQPEQGLVGTDTLVLTSVHRYGLYVAEALHARVLPLQLIAFADSWDQVEAAATQSTLIVGQDSDYGGLWLWNKLAAGAPGTPAGALPPAYTRALAEAENVVIVQPDDNWTTCTDSYCWDVVNAVWTGAETPVYLHTSLTRSGAANTGTALYADAVAAGQVSGVSEADVANLKQWEWGVPDSTITNLRAAWAALGKPADHFTVIRDGVVDMYAWTPWLWRAYLDHNGVPVRGFNFESYWAAYPAVERYGAVLPFPSYSWWQQDWHPLDDNGRAVLDTVCGGAPCPAGYAENTRAFVNTIGSTREVQGMKALLTDYALTPDDGAYYGYGINAEGAGAWTGWDGAPVASGWEIAAMDEQDPNRCPYTSRSWSPLTVADVCGLGLYTCE